MDFVRRIPVEIFEKWYADQNIYRKVMHIPTAEELEKDYICLQDVADLLGISREKLAKIARSEEIGRLLDSTICNNKGGLPERVSSYFLMLRMYITSRIMEINRKRVRCYRKKRHCLWR